MLFYELKQKHPKLEIYDKDEYIFILEKREPINLNSYSKPLKMLMDRLGYNVTNIQIRLNLS